MCLLTEHNGTWFFRTRIVIIQFRKSINTDLFDNAVRAANIVRLQQLRGHAIVVLITILNISEGVRNSEQHREAPLRPALVLGRLPLEPLATTTDRTRCSHPLDESQIELFVVLQHIVGQITSAARIDEHFGGQRQSRSQFGNDLLQRIVHNGLGLTAFHILVQKLLGVESERLFLQTANDAVKRLNAIGRY